MFKKIIKRKKEKPKTALAKGNIVEDTFFLYTIAKITFYYLFFDNKYWNDLTMHLFEYFYIIR